MSINTLTTARVSKEIYFKLLYQSLLGAFNILIIVPGEIIFRIICFHHYIAEVLTILHEWFKSLSIIIVKISPLISMSKRKMEES